MSSDDKNLRRHTTGTGLTTARLLVLEVVDLADFPTPVHNNFTCHRLRPDLDVAGVQRLLQRNAGIIFCLDGTDRNAVGITGTDAPALIRLGVASGGSAGNGQRNSLEVGSVDALGDSFVDQRRKYRVHGGVVTLPEGDSQVGLVGDVCGDADLFFRLALPRLDLAVPEGPVDELLVLGLHAKVIRHT